jgi:CheY-like chemotaxis protein
MSGQKPHVLIIEDELVSRVLLRNTLKTLGCFVMEAGNGREGEEILWAHRERISLVICDISMPVQGGLQTLTHIRKRDSDLPVIMLTGHTTKSCIQECMSLGISGFFAKPLEHDRFGKKVRSILWKTEEKSDTVEADVKPEPKLEISAEEPTPFMADLSFLDPKKLHRGISTEMEARVAAIQALSLKITPYLPRITSERLKDYSDEQKLLVGSQTYRVLRFALNASNQDLLIGCIKNLPSQHSLEEQINYMEPRAYIPVIGELMAKHFTDLDDQELTECIESALSNLQTISKYEQVLFDHKLHIFRSRAKAIFLHHPYKIQFNIEIRIGEPSIYRWYIEKVAYADDLLDSEST